MKRFDTFGAYMFDLLFAPLKRGKRAANQFFIFFKVIGRIFDGMKKDAFRLRDELNVATASPVMLRMSMQLIINRFAVTVNVSAFLFLRLFMEYLRSAGSIPFFMPNIRRAALRWLCRQACRNMRPLRVCLRRCPFRAEDCNATDSCCICAARTE